MLHKLFTLTTNVARRIPQRYKLICNATQFLLPWRILRNAMQVPLQRSACK